MALSNQCLEPLGLRTPPFDDAPDASFIYSDPLLDGLLESARTALNKPGAVVLITGDNGSGRSLQLMRLLAMLPDPFELIAFRARINTQFEAVDTTIRNYLRSQNAEDPDRALTELLEDRVAAGFDPVIAMDDAHLVGTDIVNNLMRMRSEILARQGRAPRVVLVGSGGLLRRRLYLPDAFDEDQVTRLTLRAFNLEQTAAYLRHRLQAAGLDDPDRLLDTDAIHHLQTSSQGLPGNLNREANSLLERQCRQERRSGSAEAGPTVPGVAAGVAAEKAASDGPETRHQEVTPDPILRASRDDEGTDFTPAAEALGGTATADSITPAGQAAYSGDEAAEADTSSAGGHENVAFWNQRWFVPAVAATIALGIAAPVAWQLIATPTPGEHEVIELPVPEPRVSKPATGTDPDAGGVPVEPPDLPPAAKVRPGTSEPSAIPPPAATAPETQVATQEPEPAPEPEPEPEPAPSPASNAGADPEPEREPKPEPEAESEPAPGPAAETEPADESTAAEPAPEGVDAPRLRADRAWLNDQESTRMTIQLMAAPDMAAAREYAAAHDLGGIRYLPTRVNGRDFVVILAGAFPDRASAQRAAEDLPAAVRRTEPWIRSIGSVQSVVRD
ncbi:MAG: SPOR domain-containing protein [Thioalkalivibrio sp.]|nr:SPOR domain-containing protein [Thioalkalivibrio sp.]